MNDKPIKSPYTHLSDSLIPDIPQELLDKVKALATEYGYIDVFIATHGRNPAGECFWNGASSVQSQCLTHYIGHVAELMKEEEEDEHEHGE